MSDETPKAQKTYPAWRKGWTWTLLKCGAAVATSAVAGTGALWVILRWLLARLPDWFPQSWVERMFHWLMAHVWFVGTFVGAFVGLIVSLGIIVLDARRGRLTRVK